jgi:DNA repair protein RecO (recombination protein O)
VRPIRHTRGFLVQRLSFSETSLILTWITADLGVIKTMAKGARQPQSPFAGQLDLFYDCEISCGTSRGEIEPLREVKLVNPYLALRRDWAVVSSAQYFATLLIHSTEPRTPVPEFYEVFAKALNYLSTHLPTEHLLTRYERKLLQLNGDPLDESSALTRTAPNQQPSLLSSREKLLAAMKPKIAPDNPSAPERSS